MNQWQKQLQALWTQAPLAKRVHTASAPPLSWIGQTQNKSTLYINNLESPRQTLSHFCHLHNLFFPTQIYPHNTYTLHNTLTVITYSWFSEFVQNVRVCTENYITDARLHWPFLNNSCKISDLLKAYPCIWGSRYLEKRACAFTWSLGNGFWNFPR